MSLTNQIGNLQSDADDAHIFFQKWLPPGQINRLIVIQHGYGEHSGRYGNLIEELDNGKTAFYALDGRGHGRSAGARGDCEDFHHFALDLEKLIGIAREETGSPDTFLFGHSMGGLISLDCVALCDVQKDLKGLVVSAPAMQVVMDPVKSIKKAASGFLSMIAPGLTVAAGLNVKYISHDQKVIQDYLDDPLVHGKMTVRMGQAFFDYPQKVYDNLDRITLPVYIFHGKADGLVDYRGSEKVYSLVGSSDKKLDIYDGLYHETLNEVEADRKKVLANISDWLEKHS